MRVEIDESAQLVRVESNGAVVIELRNFPAAQLKAQLRAWAVSVEDASAVCFTFQSKDPEWRGAFRIEPRPESWQFTSGKERFRSPELISLQEWRNVLCQCGV